MHEAIATQLAMFTRQHGNMSRVPFNTVFFFSPFFSASFSTAVHMYGGYGTPKWVEKRKNVEQSKHLGRYGGGGQFAKKCSDQRENVYVLCNTVS